MGCLTILQPLQAVPKCRIGPLLSAHIIQLNEVTMALVVASLALYAALASGMHRPCSVGSSPSLRRSTPLLVQTWPPRDDDIHPNEAPGTGQPRAKVGASFGPLRGRRMPRRELATEWIDAGVPKWVTLIDEALFVLASAMFVRGSLDFFPGVSAARYLEGCQLYVIGSTIYLLLALFAAHEVLYIYATLYRAIHRPSF